MDSRGWVPMQAVFVVAAILASYGFAGSAVAVPLVVAGAVGSLVFVVFAAVYAFGRRPLPRRAPGADVAMVSWAVVALIVCPIVVLLVDARLQHHGAVFGGGVAVTWAFSGVVGCTIAIYASSLVDWFFILPRACGMFRWVSPAWLVGDERATAQRRRTAKIWVVHRGLAEIGSAVGLAVTIAIIAVALGGTVDDDPMLSTAIESLGATGVAVAILGFFGPRVRYGVRFMLGRIAGIGEWVEVRGPGGLVVNRGLVIDVSIDPGIGLHDETGSPFFVPLRDCRLVQAAPATRPPSCDEVWVYAQFESVREACRLASTGASNRDDDVPKAVPDAAVA